MAFGSGNNGSSGGGGGTDPQTSVNTAAITDNTNDIAGVVTDLEELQDLALTNVYAVNEYINNLRDFRFTFSHENQFSTITCNVNGIPCTYTNLVNSTDAGNGVLNFTSGNNEAYTKSADSVETISKLGDYLEFVTANEAAFDTVWVAVTASPTFAAHADLGAYRVRLAGAGYTLYDTEGNVISSGGTENGTYRFTRTLFGFKIERDSVVLYESPETCNFYETDNSINNVSAATGFFRLGDRYQPTLPVAIGTVDTRVTTGIDFSQGSQRVLKMLFVDTATGNPWKISEVDIDQMMSRFNAGSAVDSYVLQFDNDYLILNVVDPVTGEFDIRYSGRASSLLFMEMWGLGTANGLTDPQTAINTADIVALQNASGPANNTLNVSTTAYTSLGTGTVTTDEESITLLTNQTWNDVFAANDKIRVKVVANENSGQQHAMGEIDVSVITQGTSYELTIIDTASNNESFGISIKILDFATGDATINSGAFFRWNSVDVEAEAGVTSPVVLNTDGYLDAAIDYDTAIVNTGKTWVDGKPIMRSFVSRIVGTGTSTLTAEFPNIDNVISFNLMLQATGSVTSTMIPFNNNGGTLCYIEVIRGSGIRIVRQGGDSFQTLYGWVEYTEV